MSTHASITITDGRKELYLFRHFDGYPEGSLPTLRTLTEWIQEGRITEVEEAAGWLIVLGHWESLEGGRAISKGPLKIAYNTAPGSYVPCDCKNQSAAFYYTIDLSKKHPYVLKCEERDYENGGHCATSLAGISQTDTA